MTIPTNPATSPFGWLRGLVAAPHCLLCTGPAHDLICTGCHAELPWNRIACPTCARPLLTLPIRRCAVCLQRKMPFQSAFAAFRYGPPVDAAIHRLKYHADFLSARWLAEAMAEPLARVLLQRQRDATRPLPDLLIPLPLHATRLRTRGYNQSMELARILRKSLQTHFTAAHQPLTLTCAPTLTRRVRATEDQIGKTALERRRNVRGAFAGVGADKNPSILSGRRIALLDDVMTTGSTAAELARACRRAGAESVEVWAVARAE